MDLVKNHLQVQRSIIKNTIINALLILVYSYLLVYYTLSSELNTSNSILIVLAGIGLLILASYNMNPDPKEQILKSIFDENDGAEGSDNNTDSEKSGSEEDSASSEEIDREVEAYRRIHEDVQRTLDQVLVVFSDEAEKAGRIGQFNGLVLTIFITAATGFEYNIQEHLNSLLLLGVVLLLIGFGGGMYVQRTEEVVAGVGADEFSTADQYNMTELEYLRWVTETGYSSWIKEAKNKSRKKANRVKIILFISLLGLLFSITGILISSHA